MTSTDVCNIIRACDKGGVKSLKYKGLEVSFGGKDVGDSGWEVVSSEDFTNPVATKPILNDNGTNIDSTPLEVGEVDLDELMFTDPAAWEETVQGKNDA